MAFIDILGFSEVLRRIDNDPDLLEKVRRALNSLSEASTSPGQEAPDNLVEATVFSDNIVLSAPDEPFASAGMLLGCSAICLRLLELGFLTRGGIAYGRVVHNPRLVFGRGLVEAAELESDVANYPRVLFSNRALERIRKLADKNGWFPNVVRTDFDGLHHLHYLQPFFGDAYKQVALPEAMKTCSSQPFRCLRESLAVRAADRLVNNRIRAKVLWMVRYLNETASALGVDPITDAV